MSPHHEDHIPLSHFSIPYWSVVLREKFLLPEELIIKEGLRIPQSIQEISQLSGLPVQSIIEIIRDCEIRNQRLKALPWHSLVEGSNDQIDGRLIIDVRRNIDFSTEPLIPSARLLHQGNPLALLQCLEQFEHVYFCSDKSESAWSAAMAALDFVKADHVNLYYVT